MFKITHANFKDKEYGTEEYLTNWPMVYILENGRQAYIGETNHAKNRMSQHLGTLEKRIYDKVHFIYSAKFNQSVTLDYEAKLIQYIAADEMYEVRNKNAGMADKAYYQKKEYDEKFHLLWRRLQQEGLVKRSLEEIENSDLFKYSPYKELNEDQRTAVEAILYALENDLHQKIVVNGTPGSGKTIVAVFLMKYLKDSEEFQNKKIGFVVPQTSLRETMKKIFRSIYNLQAADVLSPSEVTRDHYDILIVDEAHRLHQYKNISYRGAFKKSCERIGLTTTSDELDWILKQCDCPILFYDRQQVVGPSGIDVERFEKKLKSDMAARTTRYCTLMTQMRVKGGNAYLDYIQAILEEKGPEKQEFFAYDFKIIDHFRDFERLMYQKEAETGLSRMVAGYAWEWQSKRDETKTDIEIEDVSKKWNRTMKNWVHLPGAVDEVGCIHSIQGYDLNYVFVILGNEISYDPEQDKIVIKPENYFDQNGKNTASYEELLAYIKHIYYVLMTRGIRGTYLYVCDPELKKYLEQYIEVEDMREHE